LYSGRVYVGWSRAGAGDLDQDGFDDILLSEVYSAGGRGLAEVVLGNTP
jgi:hypothetical protein